RVRLRPARPRRAGPWRVPGLLLLRRLLAGRRPARGLRRGEPSVRPAGGDPAADPARGEGMTRVLLFGASGFIGRHARRALLADPRISSVSCPGRDRYDLVGGGLPELVELFRAERPQAIVNCTGRLAGTGYELATANTAVTAKLLDAIPAAVPEARLVR